jgi:hypothetical protein
MPTIQELQHAAGLDALVIHQLRDQLASCEQALTEAHARLDAQRRLVLPYSPPGKRDTLQVNLNQYVHVKLNERGLDMLKAHAAPLDKYGQDADAYIARMGPDPRGYYAFQLWVFMNIYGPVSFNGADAYYDVNVAVETRLP